MRVSTETQTVISSAQAADVSPPRSVSLQIVDAVMGGMGDEINEVREAFDLLKLRLAGFEPDHTGDDARRRLQNARLKTTYLDSTIRSLEANILKWREALAADLGGVTQLVAKIETAEAHLAASMALQAELAAAKAARSECGVYPETAAAADFLHDQYSVTRWHWASADPEQLRSIAEILRRKEQLVSHQEREADELKQILQQ